MKKNKLKAFYHSLPTEKDKKEFRNKFMDRTKLSYPTFYNYLANKGDKIPFVYGNIIKELAGELHPNLASVFNDEILEKEHSQG